MAEQKLVNLKINDRDLQVPAGTLVIEAAKQIATEGKKRALISVCTAGGQGVTAILESAA